MGVNWLARNTWPLVRLELAQRAAVVACAEASQSQQVNVVADKSDCTVGEQCVNAACVRGGEGVIDAEVVAHPGPGVRSGTVEICRSVGSITHGRQVELPIEHATDALFDQVQVRSSHHNAMNPVPLEGIAGGVASKIGRLTDHHDVTRAVRHVLDAVGNRRSERPAGRDLTGIRLSVAAAAADAFLPAGFVKVFPSVAPMIPMYWASGILKPPASRFACNGLEGQMTKLNVTLLNAVPFCTPSGLFVGSFHAQPC